MVRFPLPGPGDLIRAADRGYDAIERAIALVPRISKVIDQIERITQRAEVVITDVDRTRQRADEVIASTDALVERAGALLAAGELLLDRADRLLSQADGLLGQAGGPLEQASQLLARFQPALSTLAPMIDQLAATTSPDEVAALIRLIDTLPELVQRLETEILPILATFGTVAPDVRDLLDTTMELNEILGSVPGLGRIKKRVEERQERQDLDRA